MQRHVFSWYSPSVGREMPVARWGHYGKPVLFFPTAGGDFLEVERFLMVRALAPLIEAGRIKLYSAETLSREAWYDASVPPWHKSWLQARVDQYLVGELFPFIRHDCGGTPQKLAVAGASIGGYNALNAGAKHPEWIDLTVGMSGTYVLDRRMDGHFDDDFYFNSPVHFVPNLPDDRQLHLLRRSLFVLAYGTGRWENPAYTEQAAAALASRQIPHTVEVWGPDADHDWTAWRRMLPLFLDKLAG